MLKRLLEQTTELLRRQGKPGAPPPAKAGPTVAGHVLPADTPDWVVNGENYLLLLERIHAYLRPSTYVEIGVFQGESLARIDVATDAIGIDPAPQIRHPLTPRTRVFALTSDEFFRRHDLRQEFAGRAIELAFIDGMHHFEFALRDFINLERHCSKGACILLHDCYPLDRTTAARERATRCWSGDIWRTVLALRKYRPDLVVHTLAAAPTGLGLIRNLDPGSRVLEQRFDSIVSEFLALDYAALNGVKDEQLNVVPAEWDSVRALLPEAQSSGALLAEGEKLILQGNAASAIPVLERLVRLRSADASSWYWLGVAHLESGAIDDAARCFRKVLGMEPRHAKALSNLGTVLERRDEPDEAERCYRAAIDADAKLAQPWFNLGLLSLARHKPAEAIDYLQRAVALDASRPDWHAALGTACHDAHRLRDARASLETALRLDPGLAVAHDYLGICLVSSGEVQAAIARFRQALQLEPERQSAWSNLLLSLNYASGIDGSSIRRAHADWGARHRALAAAAHRNDPVAERRLRIGYVSADFREHAVAYFIEPVLSSHDSTQAEVFCYSDVEVEDAVTARLRDKAQAWRPITGLSNDALARQVADDRIDLLVDLAGHTSGGKRMLLFARKPAPVQASWLGYPSTTGLDAMDYRVTDWHASPAGWEEFHTERLVRLPNSQWCFAPDATAPPVAALPALRAGAVTFGSFHHLFKLTPEVLTLWSRVLRAVPGSRLLMLAPGLDQLSGRVSETLRANGVDPARVEFHGRVSVQEYLALHHRVDINLDSFPYTGGTSTCQSLWMGVPVATLAGQTPTARGGCSILRTVDLPWLVAESEDQYVDTVAALARDIDRLGSLRASLRERVARSPLSDAARFTRDLEAAYRTMWKAWCAGR